MARCTLMFGMCWESMLCVSCCPGAVPSDSWVAVDLPWRGCHVIREWLPICPDVVVMWFVSGYHVVRARLLFRFRITCQRAAGLDGKHLLGWMDKFCKFVRFNSMRGEARTLCQEIWQLHVRRDEDSMSGWTIERKRLTINLEDILWQKSHRTWTEALLPDAPPWQRSTVSSSESRSLSFLP